MKKLIFGALIVMGISACGDNTLKVAVIMPMEKYDLPYGMDAKNGLNLAILDIAPENVEFQYYDTEGKSEFFLKYYEEAAKNGAELVIGPLLSTEVKIDDLVKLIKKYDVPLLSPSVTTEEFLKASDKFFSISAPNSVLAANLSFFLAKEGGINQAVIVQDPSNKYSMEISDLLKKALNKYGVKVEGTIDYRGANQDVIDDLREKYASLLNNKKSAILMPIYVDRLNNLLLDIRNELKYEGILAGTDSWDVVEETKEEIPGVNIYVAAFFPTENDSTKAFTKRYMDNYKKVPTSLSALAYDAVKVMNEALKASKVYTKEEIAKRLKFVSTQGLTGDLDFGGDNILEDKSVVIIGYKGNKKVFLRRTAVSSAVVH